MDREQRRAELLKTTFARRSLDFQVLNEIEAQIDREEAEEKTAEQQRQAKIDEMYAEAETQVRTELDDYFKNLPQLEREIAERIRKEIEKEVNEKYQKFLNKVRDTARRLLFEEWESQFTQKKLLDLISREMDNEETFIAEVKARVSLSESIHRLHNKKGRS